LSRLENQLSGRENWSARREIDGSSAEIADAGRINRPRRAERHDLSAKIAGEIFVL
jgi:hypothetical protein